MEKTYNISELRAIANEKFAYIDAYAPAFPSEDQTNLKTEFDMLEFSLSEILRRSTAGTEWLNLAIIEAKQARVLYENGSALEASKLLQSAKWHFSDSVKRRNTKPRFIVDPSGSVEET